jgi:hypothetical protein
MDFMNLDAQTRQFSATPRCGAGRTLFARRRFVITPETSSGNAAEKRRECAVPGRILFIGAKAKHFS